MIETRTAKSIAVKLLKSGVSEAFADAMKNGETELRYCLDDFEYCGDELVSALNYLNDVFAKNQIVFAEAPYMGGAGWDLFVTDVKKETIRQKQLTTHTVAEALQVSGMANGMTCFDVNAKTSQQLTQQEFDDLVIDFKRFMVERQMRLLKRG